MEFVGFYAPGFMCVERAPPQCSEPMRTTVISNRTPRTERALALRASSYELIPVSYMQQKTSTETVITLSTNIKKIRSVLERRIQD